jgi:hypothetical protein
MQGAHQIPLCVLLYNTGRNKIHIGHICHINNILGVIQGVYV